MHFWLGKAARHFEKTNVFYYFSMLGFPLWAVIVTLTQLLAAWFSP